MSLSNQEIAKLYFYAKTASGTDNEEGYRRIAYTIADTKEKLEELFGEGGAESLPFGENTRKTIAKILELGAENFKNDVFDRTGRYMEESLEFGGMTKIEEAIMEIGEDDLPDELSEEESSETD